MVHRKEKQIEEANQLRKLGYSVSAIARKMQKNDKTFNRYLKQEVTAVSKAYGSKKSGTIL